MSRGQHLLHAVYGTYWAMSEPKLDAMLGFLDEYSAGTRFSLEEVRARVGEPKTRTSAPAGSGVAVLPVFGVISHRAHMVQNISGPGGTSTELLGRDFDEAMSDPKVGTIVLDIDSPGGNVNGVQELADKIRAARGEKRIIAVANALAASAAYWIGSAAEELVVTPSGEVGSIGVYAIHTDNSRKDSNAGVVRTILKAGRRKAEGHPYGPLDDDAKSYALSQINEYYDAFTQAVASNRGVSLDVARGERFGEGRTATARQAVSRGMADRVATLEQVLTELGVGGAQPQPARARRSGERSAPMRLLEQAAALAELNAIDDRMAFAEPQVIESLIETFVQAAAEQPKQPAPTSPTDARQDAPAAATPVLASPAPTAKEHPVHETPTAAPPTPGASNELQQLRAEMDRQEQIRGLASLVPSVTAAEVQQQITSNATVEQARAAFAQKVASPRPVGITVGADREVDRPFTSIGEQLQSVIQAGLPDGRRDPRLVRYDVRYAGPSGANEGIGSEGGYFLDGPLFQGLIEPVYAEDPLLSRITEVPVGEGRNEVKYQVVDETSRATGSRWGGLQMYWVPEAGTVTPTKPKTREFRMKLKKLMGLVTATEELKEDGPGAITLLDKGFKAETRFMLCDAIWRGPGGGQPIGWLNGAATVSQAIEATQSIANTPQFIALNTSKMLSRIPADLWNEAIFLYNPELFPYIATATLGGNNVPIFVPGGGMPNRPADTIWGRPAYASEFAEAVGTPGDIALIVPSQYHSAVKDKNARTAWSPHVRFVYDEDTLKITHRFDGATPWKSAVTPYKGAATRSPFITLAVRA